MGYSFNDFSPEEIELAKKNTEAINAKMDMAVYTVDLRHILQMNALQTVKIYKLWDLADRMTSHSAGYSPCKAGCSYCCHIHVGVTKQEAIAIGKRIGVEPVSDVPYVADPRSRPFGTEHPCPFLKDNICSIYENRPLTCRMHTTVASDSWGCEFGESGKETRPVLLLDNQMPMMMAMLAIIRAKSKQVVADIREYFPKGLG